MKDSTRFIERYRNELIDYGGTLCTRAEVILDMQNTGATPKMIDRWFQGYELMQKLRRRREAVTVKLYLRQRPRRSTVS